MTCTTNPKKFQEYKTKLAETVLDVPVIVERLQAIGFHDVNFNDPADIRVALAEWFSELIDQINESPEDFIRIHCTKYFDKMLPEPCDSDCYQALSDDNSDNEVMLPIIPRNPVVTQVQSAIEIHSVTASVTYSVAKVSHIIQ
ncbi:hypothetical protein QUB68_24975 [Microcoleus sp. A006_D1]|uniref:hypothetical protein n=1 Tax=Microcoleus sp. A006_D1 TaxID=3055267 RepID=UPI002FD70E7C